MRRKLLCISYRSPPEKYPLAFRVKFMLEQLESTWSIRTITAAEDAAVGEDIRIHHVPPRTPDRLTKLLARFRLKKVLDWLVWPDTFVFWVWPAYRKALKLIDQERPDAVLVFLMPYSVGLVGLLLKRKTKLPVVFNLNDSPTCTDMHPRFPSWFHFKLAHWLENQFAQKGDAIIYVSKRNMERVRARQPESSRDKFHLIRRGAQPFGNHIAKRADTSDFRIVYTGGMSGWYASADASVSIPIHKRLYQFWDRLGRYNVAKLDHSTHSPVFVGQAIKLAVERNPSWKEAIKIEIYGNTYPPEVITRVLRSFDIERFVTVHSPVSHDEVKRLTAESDLLFMTLPDRLDDSTGGRISAKTYEYLMTDRPILAAIPGGENREFLEGKPGVHLVLPKDVEGMSRVIEQLADMKFGGKSVSVDRAALQETLTVSARAADFARVLDTVALAPSAATS